MELKDWILGDVVHKTGASSEHVRRCLKFHETLDRILNARGHSFDSINDFRKLLFESQRVSVDAFVQDRPEFDKIARLSIAAALLQSEGSSVVHGDWYQWLLEAMRQSPPDRWTESLKIITFNYDRSFELFFSRSLVASFGLVSAQEYFNRMKICHVYGSLGPLFSATQKNLDWGRRKPAGGCR